MKTCQLCGKEITARQSWHESWRGLNHALCEFNQDRRKQHQPILKALSEKIRYGQSRHTEPDIPWRKSLKLGTGKFKEDRLDAATEPLFA